RKGLKTAILAERIGGQVQDTKGIENLIGVKYTEGPMLVAQLNQHIAEYPIAVFEHRRVKKVIEGKIKRIELEGSEYLSAKSIIVTTGAKWRELGIPGEKEYIGRGVAFCPHCDGPYYKGKRIAVVGGGNSGVEAAIDLAGIVKEVVLFEYMDQLKADQVLVDKLKSLSNVSIITEARTSQVIGDGQKVISLEYENRKTKEIVKIDLDGIFVQIGLLPNSAFIKDIVETTKFGEIVIDNKGRTSAKGIYAAGDVTTVPYKQIIIAMGEGAKAALAAFEDQMLAP
ncbi:MAG: FAD-dependent oxidoreductase, partial [Bacteriovorax sp.]|nr:FAD-dependent oxidoreductase [Bacteriovorax sp.]